MNHPSDTQHSDTLGIKRFFAAACLYMSFGLGAAAVELFAVLPTVIFSANRERRIHRVRKINQHAFKCFTKFGVWLGVFDVNFHNVDLLNRHGQLIIANHPSLLDVVFLLAQVPHANCVIKRSLLKNPFLALSVYFADYIRNDSEEKLLKQCANTLKNGETLIIFPEGTRTPRQRNYKFKRGASYVMLMSDCPVRPVYISCEPMSLGKREPWYVVPRRKIVYHIYACTQLDISAFRRRKQVRLTLQARQLTEWLSNWYHQKDAAVAVRARKNGGG